MVHKIKTLPEYFKATKNGDKPFEVRCNDRNYKVNDILILEEYEQGEYTGEELFERITYILDDERYCKPGYVVIGTSPCEIINKKHDEYCFNVPYDTAKKIIQITKDNPGLETEPWSAITSADVIKFAIDEFYTTHT